MHYNFYFDETFHDRAITLYERGEINVLDSSKNDCYIGVFLGVPNTQLSTVKKILSKFEDRQKESYGLQDSQEFKSTTIGKKNFEFGIKSFNEKAKEFYTDLFNALMRIKPIIQIDSISKIEFYLRRIFGETHFPDYTNIDALYYSLTKFFIMYGNSELFSALYQVSDKSSSEKFIKLLISQIKLLLEAIDGIERKMVEIRAYQEIYFVLKNTDIAMRFDNKCTFDYSPNFDGLIYLLNEIGVSETNINLIIDEEEKTYQTAKKYMFKNVKMQKSHNSIQLRLSDWISGFIGRIMYSLFNDAGMKEDEVSDFSRIKDNDLVTKRLLSKEWFEITEKDFKLYNLIYEVLIVNQQHYWSTMTTSFCDQTAMFYSLLRYYASYKSYTEFCEVSSSKHSEYYNSCCCEELLRVYSNM